ncbi:MAG: PD-(D/E)XK nuclease family protein [Planctomycetes bacterium]|nr:PD-(D/E)XK nuclease family protein [Planctomycetota bacterium]
MADLQNEFSWSKSRDSTFRTCLRQYYFHYYGSWGGWNFNADDRTHKIYVLKQLKSRQMWAGERVHDCIRKALHNLRCGIDPMTEEEAVKATLDIMRQDYLNSKRGDYWKNPKSCGFVEHEYGFNLPDRKWKETADHVTQCLQTFYRSVIYKMIRGLPAGQWLEVEDFSSFDLEGTKVHVVLDFSCRRGDEIWIYDWKTGRSENERNAFQLACYSFYAIQKWKVDPARVTTVEYNLAAGKESPYHLGNVDLVAIKNRMLTSIRDMKKLLDDPDKNIASEDRFSFVEEENECRYCNFKAVCPRWV